MSYAMRIRIALIVAGAVLLVAAVVVIFGRSIALHTVAPQPSATTAPVSTTAAACKPSVVSIALDGAPSHIANSGAYTVAFYNLGKQACSLSGTAVVRALNPRTQSALGRYATALGTSSTVVVAPHQYATAQIEVAPTSSVGGCGATTRVSFLQVSIDAATWNSLATPALVCANSANLGVTGYQSPTAGH